MLLNLILSMVCAIGAYQPDWTAYRMAMMAPLYHPNFPFIFLFSFRYLRLVMHIFSSWCLYKAIPVPGSPTSTEADCTVIIPTIQPDNADFQECLESILKNKPREVHIVTVGTKLWNLANRIIVPYQSRFPNTKIVISFTHAANKRKQVAHALQTVWTPVTVLADDHVFWPSPNFLRAALAPFEDLRVGGVGTNKRVRRNKTGFGWRSYWNVIGAWYLERHNFELTATHGMDQGVFVISGRTALYRTDILRDPAFMSGYVNERFFFGLFGPLNADDDNYITRWLVTNGWRIQFQNSPDTLMETTLGTYPKFLQQCVRWSRTTWRSNAASLFTDRTVFQRQPWCVYAVYISSLVNFALFYDSALVYTLRQTDFNSSRMMSWLVCWIFATKLVKLMPYFTQHPADLVYLPGYFVFAYFHSLIKLYSLATFWVTAWEGRSLDHLGGDGSDMSEERDESSDHSVGAEASEDQTPALSDSEVVSSQITPLFSNLPAKPPGPSGVSRSRILMSWQKISTPWGLVCTASGRRLPANVLHDLRPGTSKYPRLGYSKHKINQRHRRAFPVDKNKKRQNSKLKTAEPGLSLPHEVSSPLQMGNGKPSMLEFASARNDKDLPDGAGISDEDHLIQLARLSWDIRAETPLPLYLATRRLLLTSQPRI